MSKDFIGYQNLVDRALRNVVRAALQHAASGGVMGAHHFNIVFETRAKGVDLPEFLREQYPEAMKIVLQHQYANLKADERGFEVTLSFSKIPATIVVPWDAVLVFEDPSQNFQLAFSRALSPAAGSPAPRQHPSQPEKTAGPAKAPEPETKPEAGEVVSLDRFRKK